MNYDSVNLFRCPSFQSAYVLVYEKKELNEDLKKLEEVFEEVKLPSQEERNTKGKMELETKIPNYVKEERICLSEVEEEIHRKNQRIFYISIIFSANYTRFIFNLIKNYEDTLLTNPNENNYSTQESYMIDEVDLVSKKTSSHNLFIFVWIIYFTAILRMNDKKMQRQFFEWIYERLNKVRILYIQPSSYKGYSKLHSSIKVLHKSQFFH